MSRPIGLRSISLTLSTTAPFKVSSAQIYTPFVEIFFPSTNAGSVYVGNSGVDSTWIPRSANTSLRLSASERGDVTEGDFFDLSKIYCKAATAGDAVIVQYLVAEG